MNPGLYGVMDFKVFTHERAVKETETILQEKDHPALKLVPSDFEILAHRVYVQLGLPEVRRDNIWSIFAEMHKELSYNDDIALLNILDLEEDDFLPPVEFSGRFPYDSLYDPNLPTPGYIGGVNNGNGLDTSHFAALNEFDQEDFPGSGPVPNISEAEAIAQIQQGDLDCLQLVMDFSDDEDYNYESRVRDSQTILGVAPSAPGIAENLHRRSSVSVKNILPSNRLDPVELEKRLDKIIANRKQRNIMDSMYAQIVDTALSLDDGDDTKQRWIILHAIICVAEPRSAFCISGLLGVSPQLVTDVVQSLYPVLITAEADRRIHMCHASFRDFVMRTSGKFGYQPPSINFVFAQACVREMATSLRFNICNLESSLTPDKDLKPPLKERTADCIGEFLAYASRNWWFHIQGCDAAGQMTTLTSVEPMFQEKGIFWIEVMSLLGEMKSCQEIITELASSSSIILVVPSIHLLAWEAVQLVSTFEAIPEKNTSHVYLTGLALSEGSPNIACWTTQFSSLPHVMARQKYEGQDRQQLDGHTDYVRSVAFSPNGKHIVSGSDDRTVCIWDVESGRKVQQLNGHNSYVYSVAFSPDGKYIVSGSLDKTVRIWDTDSCKERSRLNGHTASVRSAAFSPDGKRVVSGSEDGTVCIWEVGSCQKLQYLDGHANCVFSVAFSPDGKRVVSGSRDKTVRLWDIESGTELRKLVGHTDYVRSAVFSPDGKRIISGSEDRTVCIWDLESDEKPQQLHGHTAYMHSVAFSPDGKYVVSGSEDRTLYIWDAETGKKLKVLEGHTDYVFSVAFSADGKRIVSGSRDKTIRVWDAEVGAEFPPLSGHINDIRSVVFSPQN
ncbi:WD40-repeat-containing domain protein [Flagelloscypha sp. PMI_526]|nr:WD40-repeat-containing domain protein [Flagelloscypha sp. PMI_526]